MSVLRSTTSIAIALLAAAPTALADKILLVDGTVLSDVNVKEETLTVVRYDREEVPSEKVLRIEFDSFPDTVGEAELMAAEGDIASAALQLYYYVDASTSSNPERREPWAPAWAAQRRIELLASVNDLQSVVEAADLLLSKFPESRYVPGAYLSKAEALAQQGETAAASSTLGALVKLAEAESLSPRWRLSAEVERAAIDAQASFAARIDALEKLAAAAGDDFPTVRDRAYVAQGEVYVAQADAGDDVAGSLQSARGMFELALEGEQAEGATRAGALVGLADCDFAQASRDSDIEGLMRARDNYLRVIVLHSEQARYVSKALYFCGLCFRQLGDLQEDDEAKARARTLMRRLIRDFDGTTWAADARRYA